MQGVKTDYSMFSDEFLEKTVMDVETILKESGLDKKGDIKISTFIKEIDRVVELKREEEEEESDQ